MCRRGSTLPQPDGDSADPLLRRLGVGASALLLERAVTYGIKEAADRRRPDDSDAQSFPSGHAGITPQTYWPGTRWASSSPPLWTVPFARPVRAVRLGMR